MAEVELYGGKPLVLLLSLFSPIKITTKITTFGETGNEKQSR
ncbi:hypothetical protein [Pseudolactococcus carnosus]|nr:hypothetical protein [Lactococcus carnosus]